MKKKKIIIAGGGSGGHIAPVRAIAKELQKDYDLFWIGSSDFESYAANILDIPFKKIKTGKLRRELSLKNVCKNFVDMFRVEIGAWQSLFFMLRNRPEKVFSTGGFVSVPVIMAAWLLRIPIIIHEQTIGFGLANKIGGIFAEKILLAFAESQKYINKKYHHKISIVGNPVRKELYGGSKEGLEKMLGKNFDEEKAILYVTGGGQGSRLINNVIFKKLDILLSKFYVIHQTGKNFIEEAEKIAESKKDYFPMEFVGEELRDIYSCADIALARSGAGTVNELHHFGVYSVFVPLRPVQNDEQTKNAEWFLKHNKGSIIEQENFSGGDLMLEIEKFRHSVLKRNTENPHRDCDSTQRILKELV